jgi:arylsulfatase A-like enzyme
MIPPIAAALCLLLAQEPPPAPPPAAPTPPNSEPRPAKPRNLLVVTLDTTRRDYVGFMGRTPSPTPNLDRLAQHSVVFTDAYTPVPLTLPAHTSLFTGLVPRSHGVHDNSAFKVPQNARTLAEILKDHGYSTGAAVASFVLDPMFGLDQGFDRYDSPDVKGGGKVELSQRRADQMVDLAIRDLTRLQQKPPFFYWLHFFDPHFPYDAPVTGPDVAPRSESNSNKVAYENEIAFVDRNFAKLFAFLGQRELYEDLVIVVCADHGESLGDSPESSHGYFLFDPTVRVPLFVHHPDVAPGRVDVQASLVDVVPTLVDLLGLQESEKAVAFDGIDLAPWMRDRTREPPDRALPLESWYGWLQYGWAPFDGCVDHSLKMLRAQHYELFDRATDPHEQTNLFTPDDPRSKALARRLDALAAAKEHRLDRDALSLSGDDLARLEELGYAAANARLDDPPPGAELPDPYSKVSIVRGLEDVVRARIDRNKPLVVELLRRLVAQEPNSADLHSELGIELADRPEPFWDEAEKELTRALELDPRRSRCHHAAAVVALKRADVAEAELKRRRDHASSSHEGEPKDPKEAKELRELAAEQRRQTLRAIQSLRAALEFEPHFPDAIERLIRLLHLEAERSARLGEKAAVAEQMGEARSLAEKWLAFLPPKHPDRARVLNMREYLRKRTEELAKEP